MGLPLAGLVVTWRSNKDSSSGAWTPFLGHRTLSEASQNLGKEAPEQAK